jgi:LmbE family N-acetylglucosaminyl deacetylase
MIPFRAPDFTFALPALGFFSRAAMTYQVRRTLHVALRCLLRLRSKPYPVTQDVVTLVFAPHQDDETLGCGGLLLLKRNEGLTVRVTYITDGQASHPGHPTLTPTDLAAQREAEACAAMELLGVERAGLSFLGVRDGTLAHVDAQTADDVVRRIGVVLEQVRPDEIFLPCRQDGSSEHDAAFALVTRALAQTGQKPRLLEYPVWSAWNPLRLIRTLRTSRQVWRVNFHGYEGLKRQALAAYASQTAPIAPFVQPVLSREFLSFFSSPEEFFFEM